MIIGLMFICLAIHWKLSDIQETLERVADALEGRRSEGTDG